MITIDDIEKIMNIVDKFDISHFEFHQEKSKVIIDKNKKYKPTINETYEEVINPKVERSSNEKDDFSKEKHVEKIYIKAAFAGIFYSVKEKDAPAFVKLYDEVEEGTVVGLIEVMKLFNEVEAGVQGTIVNVLVKDGDFVEYGQPLFEIKGK